MLLVNRDNHIAWWVCKSIHQHICLLKNEQWTNGWRFVTDCVETGNTCSCTCRMKYKFLYVNDYGSGSGKYFNFHVQRYWHKQLQTVLLDVKHRNWGLTLYIYGSWWPHHTGINHNIWRKARSLNLLHNFLSLLISVVNFQCITHIQHRKNGFPRSCGM